MKLLKAGDFFGIRGLLHDETIPHFKKNHN